MITMLEDAEMAHDSGPVLYQINLIVRDMDAMAAFYRRLGAAIEDGQASWDRHHRNGVMTAGRELAFDLDSPEFASRWDEGWPAGKAGVVIGFRLSTREAVDQTYAELVESGSVSQQPPSDAFWGARYAVVEDPDGNSVGLVSPLDPAKRSAPPMAPT